MRPPERGHTFRRLLHLGSLEQLDTQQPCCDPRPAVNIPFPRHDVIFRCAKYGRDVCTNEVALQATGTGQARPSVSPSWRSSSPTRPPPQASARTLTALLHLAQVCLAAPARLQQRLPALLLRRSAAAVRRPAPSWRQAATPHRVGLWQQLPRRPRRACPCRSQWSSWRSRCCACISAPTMSVRPTWQAPDLSQYGAGCQSKDRRMYMRGIHCTPCIYVRTHPTFAQHLRSPTPLFTCMCQVRPSCKRIAMPAAARDTVTQGASIWFGHPKPHARAFIDPESAIRAHLPYALTRSVK